MRAFASAAALAALLFSALAASAEDPTFDKKLRFAGYDWLVKESKRPTAPGGNRFSGAAESVFVDPGGALHLRIRSDGKRWYAAEVVLADSLGYGDYLFELGSRIDGLDRNVVVGLFTWSDESEFEHREIDIEFSTWGGRLVGLNAQFVVQPAAADSMRRFLIAQEGSASSHMIRWRALSVEFESRHGRPGESRAFGELAPMFGAADRPGWKYSGPKVPPAGGEHVRVNLYLHEGKKPSDGREVELVVSGFSFTPAFSSRSRP